MPAASASREAQAHVGRLHAGCALVRPAELRQRCNGDRHAFARSGAGTHRALAQPCPGPPWGRAGSRARWCGGRSCGRGRGTAAARRPMAAAALGSRRASARGHGSGRVCTMSRRATKPPVVLGIGCRCTPAAPRPECRHAPSRMPGRAWDLQVKQVNSENLPCRGMKLLKKKRDGRGPPARGGHGAGKPKIAGPSPCIRAVRQERGEGGGGASAEAREPSRRRGCGPWHHAGARGRANKVMNRRSLQAPAESRGPHQASHVARVGRRGGTIKVTKGSKRRQRAEGRVNTTVASQGHAGGRPLARNREGRPRYVRPMKASPLGCQPAARWPRHAAGTAWRSRASSARCSHGPPSL